MALKTDGNIKQAEKKSTEETSSTSSNDWSSATSENTAPSQNCIDIKKTAPQAIGEQTQKATRTRQSTLAKAQKNPIPINGIDTSKKFLIASTEKQ